MTVEEETDLKKHVSVFDSNKDGLIEFWDTFHGLRLLQCGIVVSTLSTLLIHLFGSYSTQDSWWPDPLFGIRVSNVHRLLHGSSSRIYDRSGGTMNGVGARLRLQFPNANEGISLMDIWTMAWDYVDWYGSVVSRLEWGLLWLLSNRQGLLSWSDAVKVYDGTLFREKLGIEEKDSSLKTTPKKSYSTIKSAIRPIFEVFD